MFMQPFLIEKNKNKQIFYLWCSPGFGVVDIWLPVVKNLKESVNIEVYFVFPDKSSLYAVDADSDLFKMAEQFLDGVIFKNYSDRWLFSQGLELAKNSIKMNSIDRYLYTLARRLHSGKLSKFFILKSFGLLLSKVIVLMNLLKENIFSTNASVLTTLKPFGEVSGILYDTLAEIKFVNSDLRNKFSNTPKFSMAHGLGAVWYMDYFFCKRQVAPRNDIVIYYASQLEINGYKKCYGVADNNLYHAGIPRHDPDWIKYINLHANKDKVEDLFDDFIFIIGRPASDYNTVERKSKALRDISKVVCDQHGKKIVVKAHPKERLDGIDGKIYMDSLGKENYGITWMYSSLHPFTIGNLSIFCVSFYSGVASDMLAINKPVIEYLDLRGINKYDNKESLRDSDGHPVFSERHAGLVLGASSLEQFSKHVHSIINEYDSTVKLLHDKYEDYFSPIENSPKYVAKDIIYRVSKRAKI